MAARRPYVRPMDGWWRRNPFFVRYMVRETSAVFLALYALVLLWGLASLANGAAAYDAWQAALAHPLSILVHLPALALVSYHAWTWWKVAPKTMPSVRIGGKAIPQSTLSAIGWASTLAASALVYAFIRWL
jgi:succinate dehydrogenase subunit C